MWKLVVLCCCLVVACGTALSQGLSPSAGAASEGLYTNLFFGMNYKLPADWRVAYIGLDGPCERECMLLDVRPPGERSRRALTITAEASAGSLERFALAGIALEKLGATRSAPPREISIAGRKCLRADYRSTLVSGEVYYTLVVVPDKHYSLVFSFSSESRKHLDTMVSELQKAITFVGQT